jgi:general secretion pathway protein C
METTLRNTLRAFNVLLIAIALVILAHAGRIVVEAGSAFLGATLASQRCETLGTVIDDPPSPAEESHAVRKLDDGTYEIDRDLAGEALSRLTSPRARLVPELRDGRATGLRLYGIRPDSLVSDLGLQNGDTIRAINGLALTSPSAALEIYAKLRSADRVRVDVERDGQPLTLEYRID